MPSKKLEVLITGYASGAKRAMDDTERHGSSMASKLSGSLGGAATAISLGAVAAVGGIAYALKGAFDAAEESAKISRETERVIYTTGGAAKVSTDQVGDLSTKISNLTGVDDELIQSNANLLLTFTNVHNEVGKGNDIFSQATSLALDMSTVLGTDMQSSTIQLGKALNDPIKGITALSKAGVSFTQQQKDQIKAMVTAGDTLGAQKVILAEVNKEFGGAAAAAASPFDRLKVMIGNFQEQVGAYLIPIVVAAADWLGKMLPAAVEKVTPVFKTVVGAVQAFFAAFSAGDGDVTSSGFAGKMEEIGNTVRQVWNWIYDNVVNTIFPAIKEGGEKIWEGLQSVVSFLNDHREFLVGFGIAIAGAFTVWAVSAGVAAAASIAAAAVPLLIVAAIGLLVGAVIYAYNHWTWFHDAVKAAVAWVQTNVPPAWEMVKTAIAAIVDWLTTVAWPLIQQFYEFHRQAVEAIVGFISQYWGQISSIVSSAWDMIKNVISNAWDIVKNLFQLGYNIVTGKWGAAWENVKNVVGSAWDMIKNVVSNGWDIVKNLFTGAWQFISGIGSTMWNGVKDGFRSVINWIIGKWNDLSFSIPEVDLGPLGSMGGGRVDFPNIPYLHSGGVFQAPAGRSEGLAMLRSGERVLTPEQQQGGGGIVIHVAGSVVLEKDLLNIIAKAQSNGYRPSRTS